MTEKEAKTKWCPIAREDRNTPAIGQDIPQMGALKYTCIGAKCMMWRWGCASNKELGYQDNVVIGREPSKVHGYCGLGGAGLWP